jgi:hypothetical protein
MKRTKDQVIAIYNEYLAGENQEKLDKKYSTDCFYLFKKYNLVCRKPEETRLLLRTGKYKLNWDGKNVNNETEAYFLGLLYADGWITDTQVGIFLQKKDVEVLNKLIEYICSDIKLQTDKNSNGFVISSITFCNNLKQIGLNKSKTYLEYGLPIIEEKLMRHFIRGYFDGDGTIFLDNKYLKFNICSINIKILQDMCIFLEKNNIYSIINTEIRENNSYKVFSKINNSCKNMHRLFVRRKKDLKLLFDFLYKDSTIFLDRKYVKFKDNVNIELNEEINNSSSVQRIVDEPVNTEYNSTKSVQHLNAVK